METCDSCGEVANCCEVCFECIRCCNKTAGEHLASLKIGTPFELERRHYIRLSENEMEEVLCLNSDDKTIEELFMGMKVKPIREFTYRYGII